MRGISGRGVRVKLPIYSTADIVEGALIMPGVTADTNVGMFIQASGAAADSIGVLTHLHDHSEAGSSAASGATWVYGMVELHDCYAPLKVFYDQTDDADVASTSGTTVTITSLDADIDSTWLYAVSGTGANLLAFCVSTASGSAVTKTATGWDSTTDVIKILRLGHQLAKLDSTASKFGTDAADGTLTCVVLENHVVYNGKDEILDPTKHDNLTLPAHAQFYSIVIPRNTFGHTTE